jgi:hypothetical protein
VAILVALDIAEPPDIWADLGFRVDGATVWVDGVGHRLDAPGKRIAGWALAGIDRPPGRCEIDGLATEVVEDLSPAPTPGHANGVIGLDHVVVATPDHARTVAAFEAVGMRMLRERETGTYGAPMRQAFFRVGPAILEVVGGAEPSGDGPAGFFGLAWTCADLDATASWFGSRLHAPKEAVQPGRRIATLDQGAGSRIAMAFMSPEPAR